MLGMSSPNLFDLRQDLYKKIFNEAQPYDRFLADSEEKYRARWESFRESLVVPDKVATTIRGFSRQMNILVLAGAWCGDCARQCPMLEELCELSHHLHIRYLDNQAVPELRDEFRIHGAARVPVVIILSEDYFEVARFGDKTLSAYRRKAKRELGAACDSGIGLPPQEELQEELAEWSNMLERSQLMLRVSPFLRARHND